MSSEIITIGSGTIDVFIECDSANIVSVSSKNKSTDFMSFAYGSKLEVEGFSSETGGGGINTAANFVNLGYKTAAIIKLGNDFAKKNILRKLDKLGIDDESVCFDENEHTGFSVILMSFQGDRTVLAHRGANAKLKKEDIDWDAIKKAKWLYIAPLNGESAFILDELAEFAEKHNVNMALNVGTTNIKQGKDTLDKVIKTAEILIMNREEASMLTEIQVRPDTKEIKYSQEEIHIDIRKMLEMLKNMGAKVVVITDGKKGAYAYDGKNYYKCSEYPAVVKSTLGAGDCFASTFVASMDKTDWDIEKSLKYASVNAASKVETAGAQKGLLTFKEIEKRLQKQDCEFKKLKY
ncbi:carbohydrate kinase family protein [bacterium]|nr:carbohydrate kinase family protein [bacterium]